MIKKEFLEVKYINLKIINQSFFVFAYFVNALLAFALADLLKKGARNHEVDIYLINIAYTS